MLNEIVMKCVRGVSWLRQGTNLTVEESGNGCDSGSGVDGGGGAVILTTHIFIQVT